MPEEHAYPRAPESTTSDLCFAADTAFQLVDQVGAALVRVLESAGPHSIACRRGCNACCVAFVRVTHAEAARIAVWLLAPERSGVLARFRGGLSSWRSAIGPEVAQIEDAATRHTSLPPPEPEGQRYLKSVRTYARRKLMCAFNGEDGSCQIHPVRPIVCRTWYVAGTGEFCTPGARGQPLVLQNSTLNDMRAIAQAVLRDASAQAGRPRITALASGVESALSNLSSALT